MREPRLRASFVLPVALLCAGAASLLTVEDGALRGSREASASVSIAVSLEDLARASSLVARVTPVERTSTWEDGRIVTTTRVRVDEVIAGAAGARELRVRTLGGRVDKIGQIVEGEAAFTANEPSIVFLTAVSRPLPATPAGTPAEPAPGFVVAGRAQGQLLVKRDSAGREIVRVGAVGELVERRLHPPLRDGGQRITTLDGALVSSLAATVKSAWEAGHAK